MTWIVGAGVAAALAVIVKVAICTVCRDGWLSGSKGRGTCSWHGGIFD
jgi:hypothetical protein